MRFGAMKKKNNAYGQIVNHLRKLAEKRCWIFFIAPSFIGVMAFLVLPYMDIFRRAFLSSTGKDFVGVENFKQVFVNDAFCLAVKNTVLFMMICIPLLLFISLMVAVYVYQYSKIGQFLKTIFLIPMAIPIATVVLIWNLLFDYQGIINAVLNAFDINTVDWMNTSSAMGVLIASYLWRNSGYHIILWIAGLSMIPETIYEAARLDGANELQIFRRITLPSLRPMAFIIIVLALINSFKVFREVYLVAGNYPHESIYMIQHLFNNWFRELSLDKMAAAAMIISIMLIGLIFLLQKAWENKT